MTRLRAAASLVLCLALCSAGPSGAQVIPAFDYGTGPLADARLGFAASFIADLLDAPTSLVQPTTRRFIDDAFARLDALAPTPDLKTQLRDERMMLAKADDPAFDRAATVKALRQTNAALLRSLDASRANAFVIGGLADQIGYNARVLQESDGDRFMRNALRTLGDLDAILPALAGLRGAVGDAPDGDWRAIARADDRFAAALLGADPLLLGYGQPARPGDVWTILVRFRSIADEGPRKGSLHAALDVVYADGSHKTLGAYPDGKFAFDHDGGRLLCVVDLEPTGGSSTVTPVAPPRGLGYDELAQRLLDGCTAFNQGDNTYDALGKTGYNDNSFVVGVLVHNGVNTAELGVTVPPAANPAPSSNSVPPAVASAAPLTTAAPTASPQASRKHSHARASPAPTPTLTAEAAPTPTPAPAVTPEASPASVQTVTPVAAPTPTPTVTPEATTAPTPGATSAPPAVTPAAAPTPTPASSA